MAGVGKARTSYLKVLHCCLILLEVFFSLSTVRPYVILFLCQCTVGICNGTSRNVLLVFLYYLYYPERSPVLPSRLKLKGHWREKQFFLLLVNCSFTISISPRLPRENAGSDATLKMFALNAVMPWISAASSGAYVAPNRWKRLGGRYYEHGKVQEMWLCQCFQNMTYILKSVTSHVEVQSLWYCGLYFLFYS